MKILPLFIILSSISAFSQDKVNLNFGKISPSDFNLPKNNIIDSNANAVIISDFGTTSFIGNKKGWFTLVSKRHTRIKIINEKAFDLATVRLDLYIEGDEAEKLVDLKASTYTLEDGKIVDTKLEKNDLFEEKLDKNHIEKKFTMPAIRAGSIIEYTYTINSDFLFNTRPWAFQHVNYPCLWSEYKVTIPNLLIYVATNQGIHSFYIDQAEQGEEHYSITTSAGDFYADQKQDLNVSAITNIHRYVMKDIPAFQIETYLTSPKNFLDRIELQLSKTSGDGETYTEAMDDWKKFSGHLLERDDFGAYLREGNFFGDKVLSEITNNSLDKLQVAKLIYNFIKNNFTCNYDGRFLMTNPLKTVYRMRTGNVADINLLLLSMLIQKGISCEPILLSTRAHGLNFFNYPILSKYNYIICKVNIDGKSYYLDPTHPRLGFGKLDVECYNGKARIINGLADEIEFTPDSVLESKTTLIYTRNDEKGNLTGSVHQVLGSNESYQMRNKIREKGEAEFWKDLRNGFGKEFEIFNIRIDSLDNLEEDMGVNYEFLLSPEKKDVIYFNPMFDKGYKENPFKSEQRLYPVEMPYTIDETYLFTMEIPEGYIVDELPQQLAVKLNEQGEGRFEYLVSQSGNLISLKSHLKLSRTTYQPKEYDQLREFFNLVIKKHNEQIVFKKKK
jgi:hypothetical protein